MMTTSGHRTLRGWLYQSLWISGALLLLSAAPAASKTAKGKIKLDLYIMSLCPFGVQAENGIIPAVRSLGGKVDLKLHFIGGETPGVDGKPIFTSLHREPEVKENIRQVCAMKLFPGKYLEYILERNKNYRSPEWRGAAKAAGLNPERIEKCAASAEGTELYRKNLEAHRGRKASSSPTIDIDGRPYAQARTQGWFTLALCAAMKDKGMALPKACREAKALAAAEKESGADGGCGAAPGAPAGPSPAFDIRIVTEKSCGLCRPTLAEDMARLHPGAKIRILDLGSKEGRGLIARHRAKTLPLYVLDKEVEKDVNFSRLLPVAYYKSRDSYLIRTGPTNYFPSVQLKRKRTPRHMDIFVESLSSLSAQAESDFIRFMVDEAKNVKNFTFSFHFVTQQSLIDKGQAPAAKGSSIRTASLSELGDKPGALQSPRGAAEIQENVRQLCLFQHAPIGTYFTYLGCRNRDLQNPNQGEICLTRTSKRVKRCIEKGAGMALLRKDASLARNLEITGEVPAFLWENRYGPFGWNKEDWRSLILGGKAP